MHFPHYKRVSVHLFVYAGFSTCLLLYIIVEDECGIDWDSPSGVDNDGIVEIPETELPLTDPHFEELKQKLNPLEPCANIE